MLQDERQLSSRQIVFHQVVGSEGSSEQGERQVHVGYTQVCQQPPERRQHIAVVCLV